MPAVTPIVDASGIAIPDYDDILQELRNAYWSIYGADADLDSDTQDGQFLAIIALAIYNCNSALVAVYNSFSPATAVGVGLSSVVKINGLQRGVPTNSQAVVECAGTAGTAILGGQVESPLNDGVAWDLPATVTIPDSGAIDVTATCSQAGSNPAPAGSWTILTPTRGWQGATSAVAATPGAAVETDAALRQRQSASTGLPAQTPADAIYAEVANAPGVARAALVENDTDATDANGIPSHSVAVVVLGGSVLDVAEAIARKKPPGIGTAGDVIQIIFDSQNIPNTIRFYELSDVTISVQVTIQAKAGYTATTGLTIVDSVVAFLLGLAIGEYSYLNRLFSPANLGGTGLGATFVVTGIEQSRDGDPPAAVDIPISFREAAFATAVSVTLIVT